MPQIEFLERLMAGVDAFRSWSRDHGGDEPTIALQNRYIARWSLYDGTAFDLAWKQRPASERDPRLYINTRLLWKHVESTVDFYATTVYQGALSTDGRRLPGGQPEAIPIDTQVGEADSPADRALRAGLAEMWTATNWRQQMLLRPLYGAALGDCLTEIIDDVPGRKVAPVTIWPGYVKHVELDSVGNVRFYVIEYMVHERPVRIGDPVRGEIYKFTKEISGDDFRYFKDEKPFAYLGPGTEVVPNPYRGRGDARGFVPAVWDRHKQVWGDRGHCAFEGTMAALMEVNSFLSHGFDYQRKGFSAPVIIQGSMPTDVDLSSPPPASWEAEVDAADRAAEEAETWKLLFATGDKVGLHQAEVNLGQSLALIERIQAGVERENPEGMFYERLGNMTQSTGPAMERATGNVSSRCRWARAGYDTQSVKQFQMQLAIAGMRVNSGDWGAPGQLTKRQQAWRPFSMDSYKAGELDFLIADRGVVLPTPEEVVRLVQMKEAVTTEWGMRDVGISEADRAAVVAAREEEQRREEEMAAGMARARQGPRE